MLLLPVAGASSVRSSPPNLQIGARAPRKAVRASRQGKGRGTAPRAWGVRHDARPSSGLQLLGGASWEESKGQLLSAPLQQNLRASLQACEVKGLKKKQPRCSLLPAALRPARFCPTGTPGWCFRVAAAWGAGRDTVTACTGKGGVGIPTLPLSGTSVPAFDGGPAARHCPGEKQLS